MNEELISIIVLTYNSSATVIQTLESILSQTYSYIEIIVADDCSTDDTLTVVGEWLKKNPVRGKVIEADRNSGIPANANRGIRAAIGNLVKLIAGDDILYPSAIEKFYKYYLMDKMVIWQAKWYAFGENEENVKLLNQTISDKNDFFTWSNKEQYMALSINNRITAPAIGLIERKTFEKYGYYDESITLMEDYPFFLKMSGKGFCFRLIDECLVGYRISNKSVSGIGTKKYYECQAKFFFKTRLFAMLRNGCIIDLAKQFVVYLLLLFNVLIVKENGTIKVVHLKL